MVDEPVSGQHRNLLEGAGFFEKVGGAGDHGEFAWARHRGLRASIQLEDHLVASSHDQQRGRVNFGQRLARQIRPPAA